VIYVASTSLYLAGAQLPLLRRAVADGWRVIAATPPDSDTHRLQGAGIEYRPLPIERQIARPIRHYRSFIALLNLYRRERPGVAHHFTTNPIIYGSLAARAAHVPLVVNSLPGLGSVFTSRRWDAAPLRAWIRTGLRVVLHRPNTWTTFENPTDLSLCVRWGIVPAGRALLMRGLGVDTNVFAPAPEPSGAPVLLFCGRMLWSKGVGDLVAAARMLRTRDLAARVVLAGRHDAEHRDAIGVRQLEAWTAEGIATWIGRRSDMPNVYAGAHVVVLPTRYGEGIPRVLIEAAACARPIVASAVPGCHEIVRDGQNGLLVEPGNPVALADALVRLIGDGALRQSMGRRGREIAVAEFAQEKKVDEALSVYSRGKDESTASWVAD